MAALRAVFFDVDDTLYSTTDFAHHARVNALKAMRAHGLKVPLADLERELGEVVREFTSNYDKHFDRLLVRLPAGSCDGVNTAILIAAGIRAYHDTTFRRLKPYPDALAFLKVLARSPLVRGVITSGLEMKQAEKILRLGIYPYLSRSAIFISEQLGISKPNPKIYAAAVQRCGLRPDECMYVGNSLAQDIGPAKDAGLITVLALREARRDAEGVEPRYRFREFRELKNLLRKEFGVAGL